MAHRKYHFNPETLSMERIEHGLMYWLKRTGFSLFASIVLGVLFFFLFFSFFPSPREKQVAKERDALRSHYEMLERQLDQMQLVLIDMQQRDDNLYRALFQADPIPLSVRLGTARPISYYDSIAEFTNQRLAADITLYADRIEKALYVQAKSFQELFELAKQQEVRMENLPAIQPVLNKDLTRVASGYG